MPRSRSISIQSERVRRRSPRARTAPAMRIAPPFSSSFSVSVVLPASGCEMMAKVRRACHPASTPEEAGARLSSQPADLAVKVSAMGAFVKRMAPRRAPEPGMELVFPALT